VAIIGPKLQSDKNQFLIYVMVKGSDLCLLVTFQHILFIVLLNSIFFFLSIWKTILKSEVGKFFIMIILWVNTKWQKLMCLKKYIWKIYISLFQLCCIDIWISKSDWRFDRVKWSPHLQVKKHQKNIELSRIGLTLLIKRSPSCPSKMDSMVKQFNVILN
jgi:hypothetical protein